MHSSNESSQSFAVETSKNAWACQSDSCAGARSGRIGGNVLDFVAAMEGCSIREAALKLHRWFALRSVDRVGDPAWPISTDKKVTVRLVTVPEAGRSGTAIGECNEENKPLKFELTGIDHSHPYLATRGISRETAKTFGIGAFSGRGLMSGRVVVPIHDHAGELVAYAGRSLKGEEPRYLFPCGFRKSQVLFNLHRLADCDRHSPVIVVEGFFDCLKVHEAGFPSVVALMGTALSGVQQKLLEDHFSSVVILLDGDEPGRAASSTVGDQLIHKLFVRIVDAPAGLQPDQLSVHDIKLLLRGIARM
jgi:DNA primase